MIPTDIILAFSTSLVWTMAQICARHVMFNFSYRLKRSKRLGSSSSILCNYDQGIVVWAEIAKSLMVEEQKLRETALKIFDQRQKEM